MDGDAERADFWGAARALAFPFVAVCAMYAFGAACMAASRAVDPSSAAGYPAFAAAAAEWASGAWNPPVSRLDAFLRNGHVLLGLPPIIAGIEVSWAVFFERAGSGFTLRWRVVSLLLAGAGAGAGVAAMGLGRVGYCALMPFATGAFLALLAFPLRRKAFASVLSAVVTVASLAGLAAAVSTLARKVG